MSMSDWWVHGRAMRSMNVFIFIIDIVIIFAIVACVFCNGVRDEGLKCIWGRTASTTSQVGG